MIIIQRYILNEIFFLIDWKKKNPHVKNDLFEIIQKDGMKKVSCLGSSFGYHPFVMS